MAALETSNPVRCDSSAASASIRSRVVSERRSITWTGCARTIEGVICHAIGADARRKKSTKRVARR